MKKTDGNIVLKFITRGKWGRFNRAEVLNACRKVKNVFFVGDGGLANEAQLSIYYKSCDRVVRDLVLSLWRTRLHSGDMLPALRHRKRFGSLSIPGIEDWAATGQKKYFWSKPTLIKLWQGRKSPTLSCAISWADHSRSSL